MSSPAETPGSPLSEKLLIGSLGYLPTPRGNQNGFLGEMIDAGLVFYPATAFYLLFPGFNTTPATAQSRPRPAPSSMFKSLFPSELPKLEAAFLRSSYVAAAAFLTFATLSTASIQYREMLPWHEIIMLNRRQKAFTAGDEKVAKGVTTLGAAIGVPLGVFLSRPENWYNLNTYGLRFFGLRFFPIKPIPVVLGMVCVSATSFNIIGFHLQHYK